jgi:hypothetical protein
MKLRLSTIIFVSTITFVARSGAITFTFQENGSNVDLGPTSTFTESGYSLTASAFLTSGGSTHLYAKNESDFGGSGEVGLGTTSDPSGDHEISTNNFVQLTIPTTPPSNFQMVLLASVQQGESAQVYFTHIPGTLAGATLIGTISDSDGSVTVPPGDQSGYIDITASKVNVLLSGVVVTVPDNGATIVLFALALAGVAVVRRIAPSTSAAG